MASSFFSIIRKIAPSISIALVLSISTCCNFAYAAPSSDDANNSKLSAVISNFQKVSRILWRGAAPSQKALTVLAKSGVKTIIDLRMSGKSTEKESKAATALGVQYVSIPMGYLHPRDDQIDSFLAVVNDPKNQPVYVHCRQGADRTGLLCGAFRVLVQGWSFDKAYIEARSHHFKPWLFPLKNKFERFTAHKQPPSPKLVAIGDLPV